MEKKLRAVSITKLTDNQKVGVLDLWAVDMIGQRGSREEVKQQFSLLEKSIKDYKEKSKQRGIHFLFYGENPVAYVRYLKGAQRIHISAINTKPSKEAILALRKKGIHYSPALELLRRVIVSNKAKKVTYSTATHEMEDSAKRTLQRKKVSGAFGNLLHTIDMKRKAR